MTVEELAQLVRAMRGHQKTYFRTKTGLDKCKDAEKNVDAAVSAILDRDLFSPPKVAGRKIQGSGA